ncbi:MAG: DUF4340 domain-containing protein [Desulfobacteraceae bacterium]|nr:MAG: DUF4340 domain-containing protein [Desulfobacteraceae bacterium]
MKLKKEYILLIGVIAALVLYLSTRSLNQDGEKLPQPSKLENAAINRLVLTDKQNAPLELVKKDDRWVIEPKGYPADSAKVKNMVNSLSDLTLTALVSESGNYERYGLAAGEKIFVQAFSDGSPVRVFSIGKAAPTYQHTFVVLEGDPRVYHARGQLERTFDQSIDSLRDKTIFAIDKQSITGLTLKKGQKTLALVKKESRQPETPPETEKAETPAQPPAQPPATEWRDDGGRAADQNSVDQLLSAIDHLDCDAFLEDQAKTQLGEALWTISFKRAEEEYSLSVHPKLDENADKMPATASTMTQAFLLNQTRIKNIEKDLNRLLGIEEEKK